MITMSSRNSAQPKLVPPSLTRPIPMYDFLKDFKWLDSILEIESLNNQIKVLQGQREVLEKRPTDKRSLLERLERSFLTLQAQRVDWLRLFILENARRDNPLIQFTDRIKKNYPPQFIPYCSWNEILLALEKIPDPVDGINPADREAALLGVEEQLATLKTRIRVLSPDHYFLKKDGRVVGDSRIILIETWWKVQAEIQGACNVFGVALDLCPKPEQKAWSKLGLQANPYGAYTPTDQFPEVTEPIDGARKI